MSVQPHLKKVFENIKEVEFASNGIVAMMSSEGEKLKFNRKINPYNEKNVEDWMQELEDEMKNTVQRELAEAVKKYLTTARTDWVKEHPGQCILTGSQLMWTLEVEQHMTREGTKGVRKYWEILED